MEKASPVQGKRIWLSFLTMLSAKNISTCTIITCWNIVKQAVIVFSGIELVCVAERIY